MNNALGSEYIMQEEQISDMVHFVLKALARGGGTPAALNMALGIVEAITVIVCRGGGFTGLYAKLMRPPLVQYFLKCPFELVPFPVTIVSIP